MEENIKDINYFLDHFSIKTKTGFRSLTETEKEYGRLLHELKLQGIEVTLMHKRNTQFSREKAMRHMLDAYKKFTDDHEAQKEETHH